MSTAQREASDAGASDVAGPGRAGAAASEAELAAVLGTPSDGGTWADCVRRVVDCAPAFTTVQRQQLGLLLNGGRRP